MCFALSLYLGSLPTINGLASLISQRAGSKGYDWHETNRPKLYSNQINQP